MKKSSIIILAVVLAVAIVSAIGTADTTRLGKKAITFNPTVISTQTASYTLTTSDSMVKFTAASSALTATLPAISSLGPGGKAYKILKTDATLFPITIVPATGNTIGGESFRVLTSQNAYVVISAAGGTDWTVDFESAYITEDYELGTIATQAETRIGKVSMVTSPTTSTTLTHAYCGSVISVATGSLTHTLPSAAVEGCEMTFLYVASSLSGTIKPSSTNYIQGMLNSNATTTYGTTVSTAAGEGLHRTYQLGVTGDMLKLMSTGTVTWFIMNSSGSWAEQTP